MNDKGKSSFRSYIALIILMFGALVFIFYLLITAANERKSKPLQKVTTTTITTRATTTSEVDKPNTTTTRITTTKKLTIEEEVESIPDKDEPVIVTNFSASLNAITEGYAFDRDYSVELRYSGAKFNFNCTNFDKITSKCVSGSGLMDAGTALIPLYTYDNEEYNYLTRLKDYHITINDEYIILSYAYSFKESGKVKIYDRNGKFIIELDNLILSYKLNEKENIGLYPSITNNTIYYYTCTNNNVSVIGYDLTNSQSIGVVEVIPGVCY